MNIQHSSATDQWGTPAYIIDLTHTLMGGVDLDPCSSEQWNKRVKATLYFDEVTNGLLQPWHGRVFCNPPGGKIGRSSKPLMFWNKLVEELEEGRVAEAIFVGFSIEILATSQRNAHSVMDGPFCVPHKRLRFVDQDGAGGGQPTHSNVIAYRGPQAIRFKRIFSEIGKVMI